MCIKMDFNVFVLCQLGFNAKYENIEVKTLEWC